MEKIIFSFGGSLLFSRKKIDKLNLVFLKKFRDLIIKELKKKKCVFLIVGGGAAARFWQREALKFGRVSNRDLDLLGIKATWQNSEFLRVLFKNFAWPKILTDYSKKIPVKRGKVIIGGGFQPGFSTDYDSVLVAKKLKVKRIYNLSDIDFIYTRDPRIPGAKPLKEITWPEYFALMQKKWSPGMHLPFDPKASRLAWQLGLEVIFLNGFRLKNLENCLLGKKFKGTIIS